MAGSDMSGADGVRLVRKPGVLEASRPDLVGITLSILSLLGAIALWILIYHHTSTPTTTDSGRAHQVIERVRGMLEGEETSSRTDPVPLGLRLGWWFVVVSMASGALFCVIRLIRQENRKLDRIGIFVAAASCAVHFRAELAVIIGVVLATLLILAIACYVQ